MNDKIQYFTKNKNGWEPVKFEDGSSIPPKGLLQYKPSPFEIETQFALIDELEKAADRLPRVPRKKENNNEN